MLQENEFNTTDPINTTLRLRENLSQRQPYSVPGPTSLWHVGKQMFLCNVYCMLYYSLDGHHKLIRWRLVTHAGIDGYSRMIVFIHCSNNNKAATVYYHFLQAAREFGLPSRVRSDQGKENTLVARHMLKSERIMEA